jgi:hypothetical protein
VRLAVAAVLATLAAAPTPALAGGTGLYEPFPSPSGNDTARRYLGDFGVKLTAAQLGRGVAVEPQGLRPRHAGAASRRAGLGVSTPGISVLAAVLAAAAVLAGGMVLARPSRP